MWGLAGGGVWALQWTRHMVHHLGASRSAPRAAATTRGACGRWLGKLTPDVNCTAGHSTWMGEQSPERPTQTTNWSALMGKTPALLRGGDRRHIAATGHSAWLCDTGVWGGCGGWQGGAFGPYNGPGTWSTTQKKCKKKSAFSGDRTKASCCLSSIIFHSATNAMLICGRICVYKAYS